jgi:hypothetical protein
MEETNMNLNDLDNQTTLAKLEKQQMTLALNKYLEAIKADYHTWNAPPNNSDLIQVDTLSKEFEVGLHIIETKLYYRVHSRTSVHSFIVKEDGPKFKRGDILKAAGYNTPAKNKARGNIFGTYRVRWTGAEYLR